MAIIKTKHGIRILVDDDKYEELSKYNWRVNNDYAYTTINGKSVAMHTLVTNCPPGMIVCHMNMKKRDNRLENLKITTPSESNKYYTEFMRSRKRDENGYLIPVDLEV